MLIAHIDGGWLQFGSPNTFSVAALLGETDFKVIIIMPAYRLNLFGFLYSSELEQDAAAAGESPGNHGFWDQRLALEWSKETAPLFGGNPATITLAGYSAGAYSVFHQLAYDLRLPPSRSLVTQACIWSNGPGVQPKSPAEAQSQFTQLLSALHIPASLSGPETLAHLRALPAKTLLAAASRIPTHQFRPTTDSAFIAPSLFAALDSGAFATALKARNIRLLLGECRDEHFLYATWYPPTDNSRPALRARLLADYPRATVDALLAVYSPDGGLPRGCGNWAGDAFGRIYADMQVHTLQRGLVECVAAGGAGDLLYRYRIEYRAGCVDGIVPRELGVTHATDMALWFFGNGGVLSREEGAVVKGAVLEPFRRFVYGDADVGWGTRGVGEVRVLKADGGVAVWTDGLWDEAVRVWRVLRGVRGGGGKEARL